MSTPTPEERAKKLWHDETYDDAGCVDPDSIKESIADAIRDAVAAEQAAWLAELSVLKEQAVLRCDFYAARALRDAMEIIRKREQT